ncbi:hypothetical protein [Actinomadura fibrosa]|uniref:Nuclear transport factor 2 family protein n=1 Tax=Actinomadura fibrosa TaxID=111802 RepID=A0ABW2Y308_9ACTN|nr:hypothetical protein [Actinomadura fibrosa]
MHHAVLVRSAAVLLAMAFPATACDDDSKDGGVFTPSPSASRPAAETPDPGGQDGIAGAQAALQAFLRGQAAGDAGVCRYVAPGGAFVKGPALRGNCPEGVKSTPHLLRPQEQQAMRSVVVHGGRLSGEEAVIPFSALHWTAGSMTASTLQPRFVLRRSEGTWQIVK